jgi:hypothetical protein
MGSDKKIQNLSVKFSPIELALALGLVNFPEEGKLKSNPKIKKLINNPFNNIDD